MRVNHEIKYQENNKLFLIFLKRKEIQRVPYCCFIAFSKWAKVEGYIDLGVIVPLLFKDSLKSQTLLFLYRSFAEPSTMFKFSQSKQTEGYSPFIELFWGYTFWKWCARIEYQVYINEKWVQIWSLATQICEKVKKNYSGASTEGYIANECWAIKVK